MKKAYPVYIILLVIFISSLALTGAARAKSIGKGIKTLAVVPFQINASEDLAYIRKGVTRMLHSRLSWDKNVMVVSGSQIKNLLPEKGNIPETKQIYEIARAIFSDFVLSGSITELADSFSIDARVYDIKNRKYMSFFEHSNKIDDIIEKTDWIAAEINKRVFDKTTITWEKIQQEKQEYVQKMKRKNPEYMMKTPGWQDTDRAPVWKKIWENLF